MIRRQAPTSHQSEQVGARRPELSCAISDGRTTGPEPRPAVAALIRHGHLDAPTAQLIERRLMENPAAAIVRPSAEGPFFRAAKREVRTDLFAPVEVDEAASRYSTLSPSASPARSRTSA